MLYGDAWPLIPAFKVTGNVDWLYSQLSLFTLCECLRLVIWVIMLLQELAVFSSPDFLLQAIQTWGPAGRGFEHGNTHTGPTAASGSCVTWFSVKSASPVWASWLLTSQLLWEAKGSAWQPRCNSETGTAQEQQQVNWWIPAPFWHLGCHQIFTSLMTSNCQSKGWEDSPTLCSLTRSQFPETENRMPFVNGQIAYLMPDCMSLTPTFSLAFM